MSEYGVHHRKSYSPRLNPIKWFATTMILSAAFCGSVMGAGTFIGSGAAHAIPAAALKLASPPAVHSQAFPQAEPPRRFEALAASRQVSVTSYVVRQGDSLSSIAARLYGGAQWWTVLYDANHGKITSYSLIMVGQVLKVPPRPLKVPPAPATATSAVSSSPGTSGTGSSGTSPGSGPPVSPGSAQAIAQAMMPSFGFSVSGQFGCLNLLWTRESGWNVYAANASGAYGIPQALPGSKMASAGPDWQSDASTQIRWGLQYLHDSYGSPCGGWAHEQAYGWY